MRKSGSRFFPLSGFQSDLRRPAVTDILRLIRVAQGEAPPDLAIRNVRVVNVFTGEIEDAADLAVADGRIAGIGRFDDAGAVEDGEGLLALPGFIDGHIHLESTLLTPDQFARAAVPRGTAGVVCDPHEIANVAGIEGLRYMVEASRSLPLDILITASSCVPATGLETSGATLGPEDIREILAWPECAGLGEMMNFPGLLAGDPGVMAKLQAAAGKHIDGHAPGVTGPALDAYAGAGPSTDHESTAREEGLAKLRRGLRLMIREGSTERNLVALASLVDDETFRRTMLVTDDRAALDLRDLGHMDHLVRRAVAEGIGPVRAVAMASLNTAEAFGLERRGAIAPGYRADLSLAPDIEHLSIRRVFHRGREVARDGALVENPRPGPRGPRDTVNLAGLDAGKFRIPDRGGKTTAIGIVPDQILTTRIEADAPTRDGEVLPDPGADLLKLVVVERHRGTGNVGACLVRGFGFKEGAIASSVAHDSHNLIAAGASNEDLLKALEAIAKEGGGLCHVSRGDVQELLPLPVAGLLSDRPLDEVCGALSRLRASVKGAGGVLEAPFAALSFLALPVIPEVRLTDQGLVDVLKQEMI